MSVRRIVQGVALALLVFLIAITRVPFTEWMPVDLFLVLDPLLALSAGLASRGLPPEWLIAALVLATTALFGRWFCGWVCPMGTCIDLGEKAVFPKRKRRFPNHETKARNFKLYLLALLLTGAALGYSLVYWLDPIALVTRLFTTVLAPAVGLATNLGLDAARPLAERMEWYDLARMQIEPRLFATPALITFALFAGILALSSLQPRFWCRSVCPLGGLFSLAARFPLFRRRVSDACDNEGVCSALCETGAIPRRKKADNADRTKCSDCESCEVDEFGEREQYTRHGECILCMKCVTQCPKTAVRFGPLGHRGLGTDPTRRRLLAAMGGGAAAAFFLHISPSASLRDEAVIRPPGALPEEEFLATCVRCGQCVKACPTNTLQPALGPGGTEGMMAPVHWMRLAGCDQDCTLCGQVCPTQAIRDLPIGERRYAKIGTARILAERCVVWAEGKKCLVCDEGCPYGAIDWKTEGDVRLPAVNESKCNGCGMCQQLCPVLGDAAIVVGPHGEIRVSDGSYVEEATARGLSLNKVEKSSYGY